MSGRIGREPRSCGCLEIGKEFIIEEIGLGGFEAGFDDIDGEEERMLGQTAEPLITDWEEGEEDD